MHAIPGGDRLRPAACPGACASGAICTNTTCWCVYRTTRWMPRIPDRALCACARLGGWFECDAEEAAKPLHRCDCRRGHSLPWGITAARSNGSSWRWTLPCAWRPRMGGATAAGRWARWCTKLYYGHFFCHVFRGLHREEGRGPLAGAPYVGSCWTRAARYPPSTTWATSTWPNPRWRASNRWIRPAPSTRHRPRRAGAASRGAATPAAAGPKGTRKR